MNLRKNLSRRDFMKLCGLAAAVTAAPTILVPLAEASAGPGRFAETRAKMGTIVSLTVVGDSAAQAREAMDGAWAEIDRLTAVFDRHHSGTVISSLNHDGRIDDPGPEMLDVLSWARSVYELSGGAFDPSILPLLTMIEMNFKAHGRPPEQRYMNEAMTRVDFDQVRFDGGRVRFGLSGQSISLDGVAKGYIIDRAGDRIRAAGVKNALVNAGGDILALGKAYSGRPWRVAVQDPFRQGRYYRVIHLHDMAVATSGSYEIYYDDRQDFHHLLNPALGAPAHDLVSATTIARTAAEADALATAAFVKPSLLSTARVQGLGISRDKKEIMTTQFGKLVA